MKISFKHLALTLIVIVFGGVSVQAQPVLDQSIPLKIGVKSMPPFALKENDSWEGLSIDLWRAIAERMKQPYEFIQYQDLEQLLKAVEKNQIDLVVGAISVTPEREILLDFSHPFMQGGPGIATRQAEVNILSRLVTFLNLNLFKALFALAGILFLFGFLIWFFERKHNPEDFGGNPLKGLGEGFWWSAVTMTTVGYGDKTPKTLAGRTLAIIWMFSGVILISSFTAAITSSLTLEQFKSKVTGFGDLPGLRVSSVKGSSSSYYLSRLQIKHNTFNNTVEALTNLNTGQSDAVVYDQAVLQHFVKQLTTKDILVLPETLLTENYAFAMPEGSPLREELNRNLLYEIDSPYWQELLQEYLSE